MAVGMVVLKRMLPRSEKGVICDRARRGLYIFLGPRVGRGCQQTRPVNWRKRRIRCPHGPGRPESALRRLGIRPSCGELLIPKHLRNVWDTGVVSNRSDAVNKTGSRVRKQGFGSPEIVFYNFFSQDSFIFPGAGMDSNSRNALSDLLSVQ